ncbi:MAG: epoxyqueuosine reductase QueH [Bacillota bacterium]
MLKLLMHVCCGPCALYPLKVLLEEGHGVQGYFFNPNIHPYTEYGRRRDTLAAYAERQKWPVVYDQEYPMEEYLRMVAYRETERCRFCYMIRLKRAAGVAKRGGFEAFTTTLLVSPFQKHELIREVAGAVAAEYAVPFLYRDFRVGFEEGVRRSKEIGMYRQQYCGCVYSEKERYFSGRRRGVEKQGLGK